ncbi:MAG: hypothetical protein LBR26_13255 [Prevotella sp.]|jgi:hypothetical protein|nr:hypothetical protein [Prevotella sp.]
MDKTTLLYVEREKAIKSLLNVKDISVIKKIRSILNKETVKLPAVMTVDEMRAEAMQSVEDAKQGKGKSMEQLFKEAKEW